MAFTGIGKLLKDFVINTLTTNDKTIPGAINELNENLTIKPVNSEGAVGRARITLPDELTSKSIIHVVCQLDISTQNVKRQNFDLSYLTDLSDNLNAYFVTGGKANETYYQFCEIMANRKFIQLNSFWVDGQDRVDEVRTWVSYR